MHVRDLPSHAGRLRDLEGAREQLIGPCRRAPGYDGGLVAEGHRAMSFRPQELGRLPIEHLRSDEIAPADLAMSEKHHRPR